MINHVYLPDPEHLPHFIIIRKSVLYVQSADAAVGLKS